jgi:hypothetical protein
VSWLGWIMSAGLALAIARWGFKSKRLVPGLILITLLAVVVFATSQLRHRAAIDPTRAEAAVGGLLHNLYRAFDFRDEDTVYDVLSQSVMGDLLTDVYLETRRGLELASQGGARVKVKQVDMLNVESTPLRGRAGFLAKCKWKVMGSVGHWGHIHQRTNQYEAELTVTPANGTWKISALDLLQEERVN